MHRLIGRTNLAMLFLGATHLVGPAGYLGHLKLHISDRKYQSKYYC